jgi:hypothetical protein
MTIDFHNKKRKHIAQGKKTSFWIITVDGESAQVGEDSGNPKNENHQNVLSEVEHPEHWK